MEKSKNYVFRAKVLNPVVLIIYGVLCFYLYSLSQYGELARKIPIILACTFLLLTWFLWCYYRKRTQAKTMKEDHGGVSLTDKESISTKRLGISKLWFFIACFILLVTTLTTGVQIYQSSINYQGKLSWFIHDLKNKRQVEFVHNNIYQDHVEGIIKDIQSKITMPQDLYISSNFTLQFNKEGKITSFDTYLYGKNEEGETESFLLTYDENKSDKITTYLRGFVNEDFDEERRFQPLVDMVRRIPLKETVSQWNEERYGILYSGLRSWGYNTEGIIYIDEKGDTRREEFAWNEIIGYTVSVYVPGKEDLFTPARFIDDGIIKIPESTDMSENLPDKWSTGYTYNEGEETFFLNEALGYQLPVVDVALGSRFYALLQTQDGGATWETINQDPYIGRTGVSAGITFINEHLGFIGLSHSGGSYGNLYRTTDGGLSYQEVSIPPIEVPLNEMETYNPFDLPGMPYEENGKLILLVGQGQDGDYKGGAKALYQSEDNGETWEYVKEVL